MISILIADDQPAFLDMAKRYLTKGGSIEVITTDSTDKALELLKEKTFDAIISDYEMPDMDGIELLESLRSQGNNTPFILYASKGMEKKTINAMKSGAEFFLQKSEDPKAQLTELKYVVEEIVKRRRAEEALRRREKDFHAIADKNADAMVVLDEYGIILYVNLAAISLFNIPGSELIGKMLGFPIVLIEPVPMYIVRGYKEFVATEMRMVEVEWEDKPAYLISFSDVTGHVKYEEELNRMRDALEDRIKERTSDLEQSNKQLHEEIEMRSAVEEELRVEIEERKSAEEELITEIEAREKIEIALEEARSQSELYLDLMGHDINNLNQIGIGYLELAAESTSLDEMRSLIGKPLEVMKSSSQIIENVRKLKYISSHETKKESGEKVVNLCDIIPDLKDRYMHVDGRDISINLDLPKICFIKANDLVKDVFANLLDNSVKHSDPNKPLFINIKLSRLRGEQRDYFLCTVEDNGPGIPDWIKDKVFMRFQRGITKAHGKGLGLYLVKRLVEDYHGKVWVEDRVPGDYNKGAKFMVMLPAVEK